MGLKALSLSVIVLMGQCNWAVTAEDGSSYCYKKRECDPSTWAGSCLTGSKQSPIDIPYNDRTYLFRAKSADLYQSDCYFQNRSFTLKNSNGHSAQVELSSDQTSTCYLSGSLLNGNRYIFSNMHFHWGSNDNQGSEHTINGRRFVMEGHLLHYRSDFDSITQALESGDRDAVTVIGVIFYIDNRRDYPGLVPIVRGLSSVRSANAKIQGSDIRLADFLFQSEGMNVPVAQYDGSLTTPNCTEAVLWNVLVLPCPISMAQLQEFRGLKDKDGDQLVDNYRPTQKLNGRTIRPYRSSIRKGS